MFGGLNRRTKSADGRAEEKTIQHSRIHKY